MPEEDHSFSHLLIEAVNDRRGKKGLFSVIATWLYYKFTGLFSRRPKS